MFSQNWHLRMDIKGIAIRKPHYLIQKRTLWHDNFVLIFTHKTSISFWLFCFASIKIVHISSPKIFNPVQLFNKMYTSPSSSSSILKRACLSPSRCCRVWLWEAFSLSSSSCVFSLDTFSLWSSFCDLSWEDFSFWSLSCVLLCETFSCFNRCWTFSWPSLSVRSCCCVCVCEAFSLWSCFCVFSSESSFSCRCCCVTLCEVFSRWSPRSTSAKASFTSAFIFRRSSNFCLYTIERPRRHFSCQEKLTNFNKYSLCNNLYWLQKKYAASVLKSGPGYLTFLKAIYTPVLISD